MILTVEIINAIDNIASSKCEIFGKEVLTLQIPKYFSRLIPDLNQLESLSELRSFCIEELDYIETWVNRPSSDLEYTLNPLNSVTAIIRCLADSYEEFNGTVFQVFIDEFENLREEQQRLVNDFLKHGQKPLIFSVAMKKYANVSTQTSGDEHINAGHDYVKIDLEKSLSDDDFKSLAAEVTLLRLHDAELIRLPEAIDPSYFKDPERLDDANYKAYAQLFVTRLEEIFPSLSLMEISHNVIGDPTLFKTVSKHFSYGLEMHDEKELKPSDFLSEDPRVTIVASCVINRNSITPSELYEEIKKYERGEPNKFDGDSGWIKSTLNGAIYLIYKRFPKRSCPLYSGFSRLCRISQKNLRHYQLLFSQCISELNDEALDQLRFDCELQARAATNASVTLLSEIVCFGA
jgi:hypothetical protein